MRPASRRASLLRCASRIPEKRGIITETINPTMNRTIVISSSVKPAAGIREAVRIARRNRIAIDERAATRRIPMSAEMISATWSLRYC